VWLLESLQPVPLLWQIQIVLQWSSMLYLQGDATAFVLAIVTCMSGLMTRLQCKFSKLMLLHQVLLHEIVIAL